MKRVGIITQARMTSTRLPGKVLATAGGRPLLSHHLHRLAQSGHQVVVATTGNRADDPVVALAEGLGFPVFRGSEDDVLDRFQGAATANGLDVVCRVTSDCPLVDGRLVAEGVAEFLAAGEPGLYLSNTLDRTLPRGFDFEVFSADDLAAAAATATTSADREHVTPFVYRAAESRGLVRQLRRLPDRSRYRVTVDTEADLDLVRVLIEVYGAAELGYDEIGALLDRHPELVEINAHVEQKRLG